MTRPVRKPIPSPDTFEAEEGDRSSTKARLVVPNWRCRLRPCFSADVAENHGRSGASVWKFASTDHGLDRDVVLVGIGAELTFGVIVAAVGK